MKIKIPHNFCSLSVNQIQTIKKNIRQKQKTQKIRIKSKTQVTKYIKNLFEEQKNKKSIIPLNIYQVWHNKTELTKSVKESIELLKTQNPEFTHYLFDEKECRDFLKNNFSKEILNTYDAIVPHALKADLWRYCFLYKNGGIYLDSKYYGMSGFKFILLTEELSFIPDNVLNCCEVINMARPTKIAYEKCCKNKIPAELKIENITNIKNLHININELMYPHKIICNKILKEMIDINNLKFLKFRDYLYDIFIYNLDITDCIWYILETLINQKRIKRDNMSGVLLKTYSFLKFYNNNYRPIYHLESYLFYLISIVHEYPTSI